LKGIGLLGWAGGRSVGNGQLSMIAPLQHGLDGMGAFEYLQGLDGSGAFEYLIWIDI